MNASFGCKGEIHLEVVEMFPSEAREPLPWLEGNVSIVVRVRRGVPRHCFSRRSRGWGKR